MPLTYPDHFFDQRASDDEGIEYEVLDQSTRFDKPEEPIPAGKLIVEDGRLMLPVGTTLRTKSRQTCQYVQPAKDIRPVMVDQDTGCEYYIIHEICWLHFRVYVVLGNEEYLWFEYNGPKGEPHDKLVRFCPGGMVTDLGNPDHDRRFFPPGNTAPVGWLPPLEGGWIAAHAYGEKDTRQDDDVCIHVLYIYVRQVPISIVNGVMTVTYKLMAKVEKRRCSTGGLLRGYPKLENVPGGDEVHVSWRVERS
jgi:hypothetical protein